MVTSDPPLFVIEKGHLSAHHQLPLAEAELICIHCALSHPKALGPMSEFDLVIKGGCVATTEGVSSMDIAVHGGVITTLGWDLPRGRRTIDAAGKFVLPGGVDAHCH